MRDSNSLPHPNSTSTELWPTLDQSDAIEFRRRQSELSFNGGGERGIGGEGEGGRGGDEGEKAGGGERGGGILPEIQLPSTHPAEI